MDINFKKVKIHNKDNGILIKSEDELYILANRVGYEFEYRYEFDNHYLNCSDVKRVVFEEDGICVITTIEVINRKYYTNVSLLIDAKLDKLSMINIYKIVIETISTVCYNENIINDDELDNALGNYYNTIFVACLGLSEKYLPMDITLFYELKEFTSKALEKSLEYLLPI